MCLQLAAAFPTAAVTKNALLKPSAQQLSVTICRLLQGSQNWLQFLGQACNTSALYTATGTRLACVHSQNSIPDVTTACRILARLAAFTVGVQILPPWSVLIEAATPCRTMAVMLEQ